jgi:YebC/PmpR family DNA-binding regulatory protein
MSGHSKWHTIKHKKGALDAKRGKIFTRLIKEVVIAARNGGDPDMNPRLRTAITAAKAASMPADNIKRAIMRGTGELEGGQIDEITFEGYAPGGVAILVNTATDNRNRTVAEIRHMFSKNGGNMGAEGSVNWMFERKSQIFIEADKATEEQLMDLALEAGADDIELQGEQWQILSAYEAHNTVMDALEKAKIPTLSGEIAMIPKNTVKVDSAHVKAVMKIIDLFEEHDDVQSVYSNAEFDDADLEAMA